MLCVDIETTGLDPNTCDITVAAVFDEECNVKRVFNFFTCVDRSVLVSEFLDILDSATMLCMYNGIKFDIPFIQTAFQVDPDRVSKWVLKTADVYEARKQAYGITGRLDDVLKCVGLSSKTSSGSVAIEMAKNGQWTELEDYCLQDVLLTYQLTKYKAIKVRDNVILDFTKIEDGEDIEIFRDIGSLMVETTPPQEFCRISMIREPVDTHSSILSRMYNRVIGSVKECIRTMPRECTRPVGTGVLENSHILD